MMRIHCCVFDRECLRDWWDFGAPMGLYVGDRFWPIPLMSRRGDRIWESAEKVIVNPARPRTFRCLHLTAGGVTSVTCATCGPLKPDPIWMS